MSVSVEKLSVAYRSHRGDVTAVDNVSFSLADGEIMGLAGESGSGKSTLGNALVYLDARMKTTGGKVAVDGRELPIADNNAMRRRRMTEVSLVPQYAMSALTPTRKIGKLISDLLKSHHVKDKDAVYTELRRRLALIGLKEDVLGKYSFELSGGMRQRVTIIMSTLLNPSLLVADEVTSALDVSTQRAVGEMLVEFRDRGYIKSAITITHDLSILAQIADSIAIMYAGRLAERAPTSVIVDSPLHPYTQALLASLPEVGVRHDQVTLTGIPGRPPSLVNPPTGCRFRERCPFAFAKCTRDPAVRGDQAGPPGRVLEGQPGAGRDGRDRTGTAPEGAGMTTLKLDQVSKLYPSTTRGGGLTPALRKVSFELKPGEVISLIGESGSGKTTIGKILLRLTKPTSGTVTFDGKDIASYSARGLKEYYRQVQGVFQDPFSSYNPIYRADRVFDLVRSSYFPQVSDKEWSAKIEAALDAVALNPGDVLGKYPHQLSGGQQQRLLIARALLLDVKVLIADEIISMLDASTRVDVLNLLVKLKRQGLAILFITHDLSLGNYVSDRTIILRHGAIVEMGATEKIFGNPQHDYTKMLLTAVPELHKKWQHTPLDPVVVSANGAAAAMASPNGKAATALAHASMLDEITHAEQVVKRDLRAVFGGGRAVASGKSQVAVALEPPVLHEFEPDHLVAEPE